MILVDTGFWLALANQKDRRHPAAKRALAQVEENLVTTWPVMTETCRLLASRVGDRATRAFIESATRGAFEIFELSADHLPRIAELMLRYAKLPMDLADASLVIARTTCLRAHSLDRSARFRRVSLEKPQTVSESARDVA